MIDRDVPSVVLLAGPSGAGKSTFADTHFPGVVAVSSDHVRVLLFDDEAHQANPGLVFSFVRRLVDARLSEGKFTVVDATMLDRRSRKPYLQLAAKHQVPCHLIVVSATLEQCLASQRQRRDAGIRWVPDHAVIRHADQHDRLIDRITCGEIHQEGFDSVRVIDRDGIVRSFSSSHRPVAASAGEPDGR